VTTLMAKLSAGSPSGRLPTQRAGGSFAALVLASLAVATLASGAALISPATVADADATQRAAGSVTGASYPAELGPINTDPTVLQSAQSGFPSCPTGQAPWIHHLERVTKDSGGAASYGAALSLARPDIGTYEAYPFSERTQRGPVWIVAGSATFIANTLKDGTWVVSPTTFNGCREIPAQYRRSR